MISQIYNVLKQSVLTFTAKNEQLYHNIEVLKALLDKTTAEDVSLHPQFMKESFWDAPNKAPASYIDIYEDDIITVGIFVLKPGMKLPLHNHPEMHGLLKVIAGKIKITSYSLNTDKTREHDMSTEYGDNPAFMRPFVIAEKCSESVVDSKSESCLLTPQKLNIHEIESVDGVAAFIDILSPPYESATTEGALRKCSYYTVLKELAPNIFKLQEGRHPSWYWTDTFPYEGPLVFANKN